MGDESFTPATGGFMFKTSDDGEWQNLGYVSEDAISFVSDSDEEELDVWAGKPFDSCDTGFFAVKPTWWALNELYKIAFGRPMYTVPSLRRDNKGHRRNRCK